MGTVTVNPSAPPPPADLWGLVSYRPQIDPTELASAVESQISSGDLDSRTRLLIRDAVEGLRQVWEPDRFEQWLRKSAVAKEIKHILLTQHDPPGFPSLARRLMAGCRVRAAC